MNTRINLGVAEVLANWQNVFRAINLATGKHILLMTELTIVKLSSLGGEEEERKLPEMLVRIPVNTEPAQGDLDKSL